MEIKTEDLKKLRETTGAGMLDCKNALTEAAGDFKKAERILKELGKAVAQKRVSRATKEGRIFSKITKDLGGLLEILSETDFVARNKDFVAMGEEMVNTAVAARKKDVTPDMNDKVAEAVSRIKENMTLRRYKTLDASANEYLVDYLHGEGKIGVMVKLKLDDGAKMNDAKFKTFAFDCALHCAAYNPRYLCIANVDEAFRKEQEEIAAKQSEGIDKPKNVLEGIIKGKAQKQIASVCFLDQQFVKDDKITVAKACENIGKEIGTKVTVSGWLYMQAGEEIA